MHQYNASDSGHQRLDGGYAVSEGEDLWGGWSWGAYRSPAYTGAVRYTDGTAQTMGRRERPFVLFGEGGKPEVLYTAVCATAPFEECFAIANPLSPRGFQPNSRWPI